MLFMKFSVLPAIFLCSILAGCRSYEVAFVQTAAWKISSLGGEREIGIGYFETIGVTQANRINLTESLAFALREKGYNPRESAEISSLLAKNDFAVNRILTENEVIRFSGLTDVTILLQGRFEEILTRTLLEDRLQVVLHVSVFDMQNGLKVAEIKLFGKDMLYLTGRETLEMSRRVSDRFALMMSGK